VSDRDELAEAVKALTAVVRRQSRDMRAMRRELQEIRRLVLAPRLSGARDERDVELLQAIYRASRELPFTATALLKNAELTNDASLRAALLAADIDGGRDLSWFLRRFEDCDVAGLVVTRGRLEHRDGVLWQILRVSR
jgi:hypothetical protein